MKRMLVCYGKISFVNKDMVYHLVIFKPFNNYTEKKISASHRVKSLGFNSNLHT